MVSETGGPFSGLMVRITSTRSFGRMKPPAELAPRLSMVIATARRPAGRIADMKPPLPLMSFSRRTGSPVSIGLLTTEPARSSTMSGSSVFRISPLAGALSGQGCQRRSAAFRLLPIGRSEAATSTSKVGAAGAGPGSGAGGGDPCIISAAPPPAASATPKTAIRANFMDSNPSAATPRRDPQFKQRFVKLWLIRCN